MKFLIALVIIVAIGYSATVLASGNTQIAKLDSLTPTSGKIYTHIIPSSVVSQAKDLTTADSPASAKSIALACRSEADKAIGNGSTAAASQGIYYDCLQNKLDMN